MTIRSWLLIITFTVSYIPPAYAAGFNCSGASTAVERMICSDPEITKLDEDLNVRYKACLRKSAEPELMRQRQNYWLEERNSCGNVNCVKFYYYKRISELTQRVEELEDIRLKLEIPKNPGYNDPSFNSKDMNPAFCGRFLESLKLWKGVAILKPVVKADSINDPALRKYFGNCKPLKFAKNVQIDLNVWNEKNLASLPEDEREGWGVASVMTKGFRLYKTNIDNDPSNQDELILYGAGTKREGTDDSETISLAYFNVIDTRNCRITNSAQVQDVVNKKNESFAGIMKYDNKNYVFDAEYKHRELLWAVNIMQWEFSSRSVYVFRNVCKYIAKDN